MTCARSAPAGATRRRRGARAGRGGVRQRRHSRHPAGLPPRRLVRRRGRGRIELLLLDLGRGGRVAVRPRAAERRHPRLGPNRIGQGIEFDYCCVHAAQSFRDFGFDAVMVNCNPETVSTDYDIRPALLRAADSRARPRGLRARGAGRRRHPVRRPDAAQARARDRGAGHRSSGRRTPRSTSPRTASASAARPRARRPLPAVGDRGGLRRGVRRGGRIGYPVLVRPSYVLGGRRCGSAATTAQLEEAMRAVVGPVLVDRFVEHAIELDVDAPVRRRGRLHRGGDAARRGGRRPLWRLGVRPAGPVARRPAALEVEHVVRRLGPALGVVGLLNVQLAIADGTVYVLEANPRSRTVPFASKAIGVNLVDAACRLAAGASLRPGCRAESPRR